MSINSLPHMSRANIQVSEPASLTTELLCNNLDASRAVRRYSSWIPILNTIEGRDCYAKPLHGDVLALPENTELIGLKLSRNSAIAIANGLLGADCNYFVMNPQGSMLRLVVKIEPRSLPNSVHSIKCQNIVEMDRVMKLATKFYDLLEKDKLSSLSGEIYRALVPIEDIARLTSEHQSANGFSSHGDGRFTPRNIALPQDAIGSVLRAKGSDRITHIMAHLPSTNSDLILEHVHSQHHGEAYAIWDMQLLFAIRNRMRIAVGLPINAA